MTALALLTGYLIGSVPTADWLGRLWGVDLRRGGSGNPGANNARRLGGYPLATAVLAVEVGKGLGAVVAGLVMADESGAVAAGLGAVAGNVYNVWYRFQGGKGLGITAGVLLGIWPTIVPPALVVLGASSALARSTGKGALITLVALIAGAVFWESSGVEMPWGVEDSTLLLVTALGITLIIARRHWEDARRGFRSPAPR